MNPTEQAFFLVDGGQTYAEFSNLLLHAINNSKSDWYRLTIATQGGDYPEARVIIMRDFNPKKRRISFQTDLRSPKIAQMRLHPKGTLLGYDHQTKLQARMYVRMSIHANDKIAWEAWQQVPPNSRINYATMLSPSAVIGQHQAAPKADQINLLKAYQNFAVVDCDILKIDFLYLTPTGNRRALITWDNERWNITPLTP